MRILFSALLFCALAAVAATGCGKPTSSGPGTTKTNPPPPPPPDDKAGKDFQLSADPAKLELKQEEKKEIKLSVKRGDKFGKDAKIEVTWKAGAGLTVTPDKKSLDPADQDLSFTIAVAKDAAPGKVEVKATAAGGGHTHDITIEVEISKKAAKPPEK